MCIEIIQQLWIIEKGIVDLFTHLLNQILGQHHYILLQIIFEGIAVDVAIFILK